VSGLIFDANFKTRCSGHDGVEKLLNVADYHYEKELDHAIEEKV